MIQIVPARRQDNRRRCVAALPLNQRQPGCATQFSPATAGAKQKAESRNCEIGFLLSAFPISAFLFCRTNTPVTTAQRRDNLPSGMLRRLLFLLITCLIAFPSAGVVVVPQNSSWQFFEGLSEASTPDPTAWRDLDFADAGWSSGPAAFFYENQPGSAYAYTGNTVLS